MAGPDVDMRDAPAADDDAGRSEAGTVLTATAPSDAPSNAAVRSRGRHNLHRRKSVYDAVAGRVRIREPRPPKWPGQPVKYRNAQLAPEEALFRAANAPDRYEETDTYFAHADLADGVLPPSELVKAVHHYAGHFYEALDQDRVLGRGPGRPGRPRRRRLIDERSMDETALLAFGILLEEASRAVLGADGALVLTEAADESREDEDGEGDGDAEGAKSKTGKKKAGANGKKKAGHSSSS